MKLLNNLIVCCTIITNAAFAQPGTLDNTFGNEGKVIGENYLGYSKALAVQTDGKLIAAGQGNDGITGGFLLVRYNTDGIMDNTFGKQGIVITEFNDNSGVEVIKALAIQEDGKIIAAGHSNNNIDITVARYLNDGSPDSSFGKNGIAVTDLGKQEFVSSMALQPDGKIVVAGLTYGFGDNDTKKGFTVRYRENGKLDESFGNKGGVVTTFETSIKLNSITVQPDGKIIIGGISDYITASSKFLLIRYLSDGSIDGSFGTNGIVKDGFTGYTNTGLNSILLYPDGKIIAAGSTSIDDDIYMAAARFESNGEVDISFGSEGKVVTDFKRNVSFAISVLVQTDGKIILAGNAQDYLVTNNVFALARYEGNGSLDLSFGTNGLQTTDMGAYNLCDVAVLQQDGKIVLCGSGGVGTTFNLARYNGGDAILPITSNKFTAAQNKQYVTLNWQTDTELNNRYFVLERSSNAVNYAAIAQVNSVGTGATAHEYNFTDKQPVQGTNYYRLKQTDADGKYSYSKMLSINYIKPGTILLLPNPAKDQLTVKGLNAANISTISLLNIQGKLIHQFTAKQITAYSFNISNISAGTYMVWVKDNNGVVTQKFIKQ